MVRYAAVALAGGGTSAAALSRGMGAGFALDGAAGS
jgi:hypothetical protein